MSYIALARKWRPRTFTQLVGQDHVIKALTNSLSLNRLHHAYLFTGTRGVGKTSIARLLAKSLNCEQGISSEPCLQCEACLGIEQGRFIDLIEIDGASRTRVEDTREILDNILYAPANGRYKIYLIDEVHMLSQHSFNALLKTLEEPPEHVKFLLATTDPQKLPITVLSRCLQFNLRPIPDVIIAQRLKHILDAEQITYETEALKVLAEAARGSMRDALSLLDQALAACSQQLNVQDIKGLLGHTQQDYALELLQALAEHTPEKLLSISRKIAEQGGNFAYVLDELLRYLHQLCICQALSKHEQFVRPHERIQQLSSAFSAEDIQLFYQIALKSTDDLQLAPTLSIGFEMTLLRMFAFKPASPVSLPSKACETVNYSDFEKTARPQLQSGIQRQEVSAKSEKPIIKPASSQQTQTAKQNSKRQIDKNWSEILPMLKLTGLTLSAAENAEMIAKTDGNMILGVAKNHLSLFTDKVVSRIEQALTRYFQVPTKITLEQKEAVQATPAQEKEATKQAQADNAHAALQRDPFFKQLQQTFSAELVKDSIAPLQDDL